LGGVIHHGRHVVGGVNISSQEETNLINQFNDYYGPLRMRIVELPPEEISSPAEAQSSPGLLSAVSDVPDRSGERLGTAVGFTPQRQTTRYKFQDWYRATIHAPTNQG
jgi:hypothetical protein